MQRLSPINDASLYFSLISFTSSWPVIAVKSEAETLSADSCTLPIRFSRTESQLEPIKVSAIRLIDNSPGRIFFAAKASAKVLTVAFTPLDSQIRFKFRSMLIVRDLLWG